MARKLIFLYVSLREPSQFFITLLITPGLWIQSLGSALVWEEFFALADSNCQIYLLDFLSYFLRSPTFVVVVSSLPISKPNHQGRYYYSVSPCWIIMRGSVEMSDRLQLHPLLCNHPISRLLT